MRSMSVGISVLALLLLPGNASAQETRTLALPDGGELTYLLLLPPGFDAEATYPVLIGMPPGAQNMDMARWALGAYWGRDATEHGWVVVSPVVPRGGWGGASGARTMGALLDQIAAQASVEGGKFHLVGCSNGGNSAFQLALALPDRFQSLTTVPGSVDRQGFRNLERLASLKVRLHAGEQDRGWAGASQQAYDRLRELGADVEIKIWPGEGHVIRALMNGELMREVDAYR